MQSSYQSVALFFSDLRSMLIASGMSVERTISADDLILNCGGGTFLRLTKEADAEVASVGLEIGTDPDAMAVAPANPEACMPFQLSPGKEFVPNCFWVPAEQHLSFCVVGGAGAAGWQKKYRVELRIQKREKTVFHQDHLNPQFEPNFLDTNGPYLLAGA